MAKRTTSLIPTGTWTVDAAHSTVGFAVKHMGIANVRGKFTEFEGTLEVGEDLASSSARGSGSQLKLARRQFEHGRGWFRTSDLSRVKRWRLRLG